MNSPCCLPYACGLRRREAAHSCVKETVVMAKCGYAKAGAAKKPAAKKSAAKKPAKKK